MRFFSSCQLQRHTASQHNGAPLYPSHPSRSFSTAFRSRPRTLEWLARFARCIISATLAIRRDERPNISVFAGASRPITRLSRPGAYQAHTITLALSRGRRHAHPREWTRDGSAMGQRKRFGAHWLNAITATTATDATQVGLRVVRRFDASTLCGGMTGNNARACQGWRVAHPPAPGQPLSRSSCAMIARHIRQRRSQALDLVARPGAQFRCFIRRSALH